VWWAAGELALRQDKTLGGGVFNIRPGAARQGGGGGGEGGGGWTDTLRTAWSERLGTVCIPHILSKGVAFSGDEVLCPPWLFPLSNPSPSFPP